jgi:hypothetical protein
MSNWNATGSLNVNVRFGASISRVWWTAMGRVLQSNFVQAVIPTGRVVVVDRTTALPSEAVIEVCLHRMTGVRGQIFIGRNPWASTISLNLPNDLIF